MPRRGRVGGGAVAALVGLVVLIVFMIQNTETVRVRFLIWHFTWSVWVLTLVATILGALAWFGVGVVRRYQRGR